MSTVERIGFVIESDSLDRALAVIRWDVDIRPGTFVRVKSRTPPDILAVVRGVRWGGGVFTQETASYHLTHLSEIPDRVRSTFQVVELRFVASIANTVVDKRPRAMASGSEVAQVNGTALAHFLDLGQESGILLGHHASHVDLAIRLQHESLMQRHAAVIGQTGSGKTNVLRLLQTGLGASRETSGAVVIFDFHDEFEARDGIDMELTPPYAFGPRDLSAEILYELLPGLSVAQEDLLATVLLDPIKTVPELIHRIESAEGSEATKRVLRRRLDRLSRAGAFSEKRNVARAVAEASSTPGSVVILKLGAVQSKLAFTFISVVVRRLVRARMSRRQPPVLLIVDEAHRLMSTESKTSADSFRFVAQEGRKFGVTMVLATQRPSLVDATVLSQCGTVIALRLANEDDARAAAHMMPSVRGSDLASLPVGQGLFSSGGASEILWIDFVLAKKTEMRDVTPAYDGPPVQQSLLDWQGWT